MAERTCSIDGCDEKVRARGWCRSHYNSWHYSRRKADSPAVPAIPCAQCAVEFSAHNGKRFCSRACQNAYRWAADSLRREAARAASRKKCPQCGSEFHPERDIRQAYCSSVCSKRATRDSKSTACTEPGCDRPRRARGLCHMHWRRQARAEGREKAPGWDERRKANYARRRALKKGAADAEAIRPAEVFDRDGWLCGLCGDAVNRSLTYPDPKSASLDHVIPLSLGGAHALDNVQCAHLACNVRKGARVAA